jgi:hypothetical protein
MIAVQIANAIGETASISKYGQLAVGQLEFSQFYLGTAIQVDVAVNVVPPITNKQFIITSIIISADRSVGANGAIVDVFENVTSGTDGTINREIIQEELAKQTRLTLTGLNIIVSEGSWVNVKTDDATVRCNISGFYVPI